MNPDRPRTSRNASAQVGDELLQHAGEGVRVLLLRRVPGSADQLDVSAPEAGGRHGPEIVQAHELLANAMHNRQRLPQRCHDGELVGKLTSADAGEKTGTRAAVSGQDV